MLSLFTLRNIFKKDFEQFFRDHNVKKRTVRIQAASGQELYVPIKAMLEEELKEETSFSPEDLDRFFYDQLFYSNNNWHCIYPFDEIKFANHRDIKEVTNFFVEFKVEFKTNQLLTADLSAYDFTLCTTRIESKEGEAESINFLFKIGNVIVDNFNQHFFCGVTIDLVQNLVLFKFNQNLIDNFNLDQLDILKRLKGILNGENEDNSFFNELSLNVTSFSEETPKKLISYHFKELSAEAEALLSAEVPENTEKDIEDFLTEKGLPCNDDYIQQIKSVLFQDISKKCADTLFSSGWVFRFIFREGRYTRASTRTENRSPIYGSKVYWHLKELIFKNNEMSEAGFFWYLPGSTQEKPNYVDVRFEGRNDYLITHYYYTMRGPDRKEKEEFVLQKVRAYLQEPGH
ncbi:hypothetical protein [Bacillus solitudinis]|uniref:hypothetical protein n=1 Tax=Bacillus solitudinis TaxID=2014074 RepID=UPI000C243593|nr:hypothetical protein [Bacillus solitudinis]